MQILLNARRRTMGRFSSCAMLRMGSRVAAFALAMTLLGGALAQQAAARNSDEARSGFAEVDHYRLYYEAAGAGQPVVLIHGNVGDRRHWDRQFGVLAKEFRVIRYDVRGYGRSSAPREDAPYADHEDLAALLDHLGVRAVHLVGWSMGSAIAIDFAIRFPERTLSLTAVGPWVAGYSSAPADDVYAAFANVSTAAKQGGRAAALQAFMDAPFVVATSRDANAAADIRRIGADYSFWAFAHRDPRRGLDPPAARRIREIRAPALILAGEHDIPACLEIAEELDASVRDSTKIVMRGAGHSMHMEKPDEFNEHLGAFLRRSGAQPAAPEIAAESGVIPAGPFQLRYRIEGDGHPTIVIGSSIYYPRVFSKVLRQRLRMVFLDQRLFASVNGVAKQGDYELDDVLEDIERARQQLKLDQVAVIGHSGHGYMALEYAKKYPQHVTHAILIGTPPDMSVASAAATERYWQEFASPERKALMRERLRALPDSALEKLSPSARFNQIYLRNSPRSWYDAGFDASPMLAGVEWNLEVFGRLWGEVFRDIDITQALETFDRPVLLALGRHDFVIAPPSSWDPITPKFRDITVRIFERSGHTPQYEEAEAFDAALLEWMAK